MNMIGESFSAVTAAVAQLTSEVIRQAVFYYFFTRVFTGDFLAFVRSRQTAKHWN
jgi:hypothetical protein